MLARFLYRDASKLGRKFTGKTKTVKKIGARSVAFVPRAKDQWRSAAWPLSYSLPSTLPSGETSISLILPDFVLPFSSILS